MCYPWKEKSVNSVKKKLVNEANASADGDKISTELKEIVFAMNEKSRELARKAKTALTACHEPGHFAQSCPYKEWGNRVQGLPRARQSP